MAFHVEQFSSTKHAQIFMWSKIAPHENIYPTDNVRGVRDKYHVIFAVIKLPRIYEIPNTHKCVGEKREGEKLSMLPEDIDNFSP